MDENDQMDENEQMDENDQMDENEQMDEMSREVRWAEKSGRGQLRSYFVDLAVQLMFYKVKE